MAIWEHEDSAVYQLVFDGAMQILRLSKRLLPEE